MCVRTHVRGSRNFLYVCVRGPLSRFLVAALRWFHSDGCRGDGGGDCGGGDDSVNYLCWEK